MSDVQDMLKSAMSVGELKKVLERYSDDAAVIFTCDYGDYHHTQQALPVADHVEAGSDWLKKSAYSQSRVELLSEDAYYSEEGAFMEVDADADVTEIVVFSS